jgi:chromosome segregation ATPase
MAADPLQVLEAFVTAVRSLASGDSYKAAANIFDQVPLLKGQIESKDIELDRLRNEINDLKSKHESHRQEELDLYCTQRNKLEAEKASLSEKISSLSVTIQQSGETVAELNRTHDGLRGQLDQAQKALDGEKGKAAAANTKIMDLQQSLKAKDTEVEKLKESLRSEKGRLSSTETQLLNLQKEKNSLQQNLQLKTARLSEVEGFATELHDLDEEIW